jgi:hypothetical protein
VNESVVSHTLVRQGKMGREQARSLLPVSRVKYNSGLGNYVKGVNLSYIVGVNKVGG